MVKSLFVRPGTLLAYLGVFLYKYKGNGNRFGEGAWYRAFDKGKMSMAKR